MQQHTIIEKVDGGTDLVVIVLAASRIDANGEKAQLTSGQKDSAMNAARSVLEALGADVQEGSVALLVQTPPKESRLDVTLDLEAL